MAVPVVEASAGFTVEDDTDQDFTINKPAGTINGDLLIAFISKDTGGAYEWSSVPSGWSEVIAYIGETTVNLTIYKKVAGESEPDNYTWTFSDAAGTVFCGSILRISGSNTADPIHKSATGQQGTPDSEAICPSVTTELDDCLILRIMVADDNTYTNNSTPADHTILWAEDSDVGNDITSGCAYKSLASQGASGTASFTGFDSAQEWITVTLAIAPSAAGGSAVPIILQQTRRQRQ
jgi:hypothetical protein